MSFKRLLPILATAALACGSETPSEPQSASPPAVLQFYGPPGNVSPGDTVTFNFVVRDSTLGKKFLTLRFDGALSHVYSFELEMSEVFWSGYVWVELPAEAEPLKTTVATLIFTNEAGLSHQKTFSIPIWDIRHYGIARFNLNSTFPSTQIRLDTWTRFLLATPDGNTLIAVGGLPFSTRGEQGVTFIDIRQ
jgi:hypothetical protein